MWSFFETVGFTLSVDKLAVLFGLITIYYTFYYKLWTLIVHLGYQKVVAAFSVYLHGVGGGGRRGCHVMC